MSNYLELLTGFGVPYDVKDIKEIKFSDMIQDNVIQYSTTLLACPVSSMSSEILSLLEKSSYEYGVSLITDVFLISGSNFLNPFGLKKCSGLRIGVKHIKDNDGNSLYKTTPYPYSPKGFCIGVRPFLRLIFQSWFSRKVDVRPEASRVASFTKSDPAIFTFPFGKATNCVLNFHPSLVLKSPNLIHKFMLNTFNEITCLPAVSFDLGNITCLRIDDPGSCERVYLKGYNDGVMTREAWGALFKILKRHDAHLSIAYVPQWVDDGDTDKGILIHKGKVVESRTAGMHYNSWELTYSKNGKPFAHDYIGEYLAIKEGVKEGVCTILSHGLTHLSTDIQAWSRSKSRYTDKKWYREFRVSTTNNTKENNVIIGRMKKSMELIKNALGYSPDIIVPSAHEHASEIPSYAREAGFKIFSSRATFLLRKNEIVCNRKIMSVYPEDLEEGVSWGRAGYPIIFVFHDYDILKNGVSWLDEQITVLKKQGTERFLSLNELGVLLMAKIESVYDGSSLSITIDLRDTPRFTQLKGKIPVKIGGIFATVKVNGEEHAADVTIMDQTTLLEVPFSFVKQSKLKLSITLQKHV